MALNLPNLEWIRQKDPRLLETILALSQHVENLSNNSVASTQSDYPAPSNIGAVNVTAADGIHDVKITDNAVIRRGVNYFLEYATEPHFTNPIVVHIGTSRNWRGYLGNLTTYWRAYSQYPGSKPSAPVYFGGSTPTQVIGGGSAGPTLQSSSGSGTAASSGEQGAQGWGIDAVRLIVRGARG